MASTGREGSRAELRWVGYCTPHCGLSVETEQLVGMAVRHSVDRNDGELGVPISGQAHGLHKHTILKCQYILGPVGACLCIYSLFFV